MKLGELKSEIMTLGFEEAATMSDGEYSLIVANGINRAMQQIALEVAPATSEFEFVCDENSVCSGGYVVFDISLIPEYEEGNYLGVSSVMFVSDNETVFEAAFKELTGRLYLEYQGNGTFYIKYKRRPHLISASSEYDTEIDMPASSVLMIAPLAAYYIWLDDDAVKASMYRNDYEQLKESYFINRDSGSFSLERVFSM